MPRLEANRFFFKGMRLHVAAVLEYRMVYRLPRGRMIDISVDVLSFLTTTSVPT